ncbi:MAG: LPD28 domain-containing protein [Dysosmobacter sp.]
MTVDARKERFELVEVLGHPMLFTCLRVDRSTVPKGLYLYEVRNDDDQCGLPVEIGRWIMVNHWGTLLSADTHQHWSRSPVHINNAYRQYRPGKRLELHRRSLFGAGHIWTNTCRKRSRRSRENDRRAHGTQISGNHRGLPAGAVRTGPWGQMDGVPALRLPEL